MRFKCILLEHQVGHLHNAFSVPEKENFRRKTNNAASVMSGSFKNAPPDAQHVLVFLLLENRRTDTFIHKTLKSWSLFKQKVGSLSVSN